MLYAIIETGGKQLKIKKDDIIYTEKLNVEIGKGFVFENVLCVFDDKKNIKIGFPNLKNCTVKAIVLEQCLGRKLRIFKYKAKHNERKTKGHRQKYTKLKIKEINFEFDKKIDNKNNNDNN